MLSLQPHLMLASKIFLAFGIGVLIGLERERSPSAGHYAGIRTFPLIALFGSLIQAFFPSALPIALGILILPLVIAYVAKIVMLNDMGLTTLLASLLTFVLGAMTTHSDKAAFIAIVVSGAVIVLLSAKVTLHGFVEEISREEKIAITKFIVVILVIFPLLPNREIGVLFGLNPQFIWLMVIFVTSLSFIAYVLGKLIGAKRGLMLTGVIGGFVSSTATAVSMAGKTKEMPDLYKIGAFSTVIASIVMFPRAMIEVSALNPDLISHLWIPLTSMTIFGATISLILYKRSSFEEKIEPDVKNPLRLNTALFFALILAVILLTIEFANNYLGDSGVYLMAVISGLADVDAITLTLSKLSSEGAISGSVASVAIVIASISNTMAKALLCFVLGTYKLGKLVLTILGLTSLLGLFLVFLF